jgi:hypothetical protein
MFTLSQGGLGIRTAVANMGAARISALHSWYSLSGTQLGLRDTAAFTFPDQAHLLTLLSNQVGAFVDPICSWIRDSRISAQPGPHKQQKWWTEHAGLHTKARLLKDSTPRDAVRISQNTRPGSSGWMSAPPSTSLGFTFDYRLLLKCQLGIPLVPASLEGAACPLGCGSPVDTFGDHMVCCRKKQGVGKTPRHQILLELMSAVICHPTSPRTICGRGPEEGCRHSNTLLGSREGPCH